MFLAAEDLSGNAKCLRTVAGGMAIMSSMTRTSNTDDKDTSSKRPDEVLAELAITTPCDKGHECIESGLHKIAAVDKAGQGRVLFCCEEACAQCSNWRPFGRTGLCRCPIRRYLAMHLDL